MSEKEYREFTWAEIGLTPEQFGELSEDKQKELFRALSNEAYCEKYGQLLPIVKEAKCLNLESE